MLDVLLILNILHMYYVYYYVMYYINKKKNFTFPIELNVC